MMDHHALAGGRVGLGDARSALGDDAARLVARDDGPAAAAKPEGRRGVAGRAVRVQVAAAHARSLHGHHDLAGARLRIGEVAHLELAIAEENYATHTDSLATRGLRAPYRPPTSGPPRASIP